MSSRQRTVRYGTPIVIVVLGLVAAAVNTGRVGNTAGTLLIAGGLILLLVRLGRDMGMLGSEGPPPEDSWPECPGDRLSDRPGDAPGAGRNGAVR